MAEPITVDDSFVSFPLQSKFSIGTRVIVGEEAGRIIGIKLGRIGWDYLVLSGESPNDSSRSTWHYAHELSQG
jgi:hypothetical protein